MTTEQEFSDGCRRELATRLGVRVESLEEKATRLGAILPPPGPGPDPAVVEMVARRLAAADYVADPADDEWWDSCIPKLRDYYLGFAEEIVRIVHAGTAREAS